MTDNDILTLVKTDLQISVSDFDSSLLSRIALAKDQIKRAGITLNMSSASDIELVRMYSAWLARMRKDASGKMPDMIRYALNNRLLSEKAQDEQ